MVQMIILKKQDYNPEQIILFGSYAYWNPTEESDLDLLIVKETEEPILARWMMVRKLISELRKGIGFSPIIITPSELKIRLVKGDPFFKVSDELNREEVEETYLKSLKLIEKIKNSSKYR